MRCLVVLFLITLLACKNEMSMASKGFPLAEKGIRLERPVRVTSDGYYLAPRFSPDSKYVLFTGPKYNGLYFAEVGEQTLVRKITDEEYVGWAAKWTADGIETRTRDGQILLFREPLSRVERVVTGKTYDYKVSKGSVSAYHENDEIHVITGGEDKIVSNGRDRYFAPVVSPDEKYIAYSGLFSGLYVYDVVTGVTRHVGPGNHPAWLPDSSGFLFDVTKDDGIRLTDGEIYVYFPREDKRLQLTATDDLIETHPVPSPDGSMVAFESEGAIYVARLVRE